MFNILSHLRNATQNYINCKLLLRLRCMEELLHCSAGALALQWYLLLIMGLLVVMRLPVSAQNAMELEIFPTGFAGLLLVLLGWDLVAHGICFTLSQLEVHQLAGKDNVQALIAGHVFLQATCIPGALLHAMLFLWFWILFRPCLFPFPGETISALASSTGGSSETVLCSMAPCNGGDTLSVL
jgi:hypothetical protein